MEGSTEAKADENSKESCEDFWEKDEEKVEKGGEVCGVGQTVDNKPQFLSGDALHWVSHEERMSMARGKLGQLFRIVLVIIKIYRTAVSTSELIRRHHGSNLSQAMANKRAPSSSSVASASGSSQKDSKDFTKASETLMQFFDASKFRPHGKMKEMSDECKSALRVPFYSRTEAQIEIWGSQRSPNMVCFCKSVAKIFQGLKQVPQFVEFPSAILTKIASRVWLDSFPPHRVIVRQGHRGENYYIVVKGRVEVSVIEVDGITREIKPRTVNILSKGQAFGEKALLNNIKRNATCVSLDPVELLVLSKDAFMEIVTMQMQRNRNRNKNGKNSEFGDEPEHIQFLSWPIEKLSSDFNSCQFYYYRRGMLICPNINVSDQVFIIKDGSCSVLLMLRDVKHPTTLTYADLLPSSKRIQTSTPNRTERTPNSPINTLSLPTSLQSEKQGSLGTNGNLKRPETVPNSDRSVRFRSPILRGQTRKQQGPSLSPRKPVSRGTVSSGSTGLICQSETTQQPPMTVFVCVDTLVRGDEFGVCTLGVKTESEVANPNAGKNKDKNMKNNNQQQPNDNSSPMSPIPALEADNDDDDPLAQMNTLYLPDLALVSNGCECISISKKTLLAHSSTLTFKQMKENVKIYPDGEFLRSKLEDTQNWQLYRKRVLGSCLSNRQRTHLNRRFIHPQL
ncbi:uncharacterized protein LOC142352222 isoform X3 [Convolutriloba macropyga]|uniref:uncharacterized protein LOC142352222 isoform X3 n=1 Tax=Convolutriloba macropyga TaxID=536237 RepID=UPI003F51BBD0